MINFFVNKKYSQYLPSRKFVLVVAILLVIPVSIFAMFFKSEQKAELVAGNAGASETLHIENRTVSDLVGSDSDQDGIADWEEALWGTSKNNSSTFGEPDATYIANKKVELKVGENTSTGELSETEKFAREFFSGFTAMNASGEVDAEIINSFSNALGQKIVNPALINQYTEADINVNLEEGNNSIETKQQYYQTAKSIFAKYKEAGIGDELDIVNQGLITAESGSVADPFVRLPIIADAYRDFAMDLMDLSVPSELFAHHLKIANGANNTGISVRNMREIIRDPLVGLEGISQYEKYSQDLVTAVEELETVLAQ